MEWKYCVQKNLHMCGGEDSATVNIKLLPSVVHARLTQMHSGTSMFEIPFMTQTPFHLVPTVFCAQML